MNNFWDNFVKRAADAVIKPVEKLFKWDPMGGIASRTPEEIATAQQADLVTFAKGVEGASCENCQFHSPVGKKDGNSYGFCTKLNRFTTDRQCCSQWDAPGTFREFETPDTSVVTPEEHAMATEELGGVAQQGIDQNAQTPMPPAPGMSQEQMPGLMDQLSQQGMGGPAPGAGGPPGDATEESPPAGAPSEKKTPPKKEKSSKDKDSEGSSEAKHTINIHVGAGGKEKKASVTGHLARNVGPYLAGSSLLVGLNSSRKLSKLQHSLSPESHEKK